MLPMLMKILMGAALATVLTTAAYAQDQSAPPAAAQIPAAPATTSIPADPSPAGVAAVANAPIPDTPENRAKYGAPDSATGRHTRPGGN